MSEKGMLRVMVAALAALVLLKGLRTVDKIVTTPLPLVQLQEEVTLLKGSVAGLEARCEASEVRLAGLSDEVRHLEKPGLDAQRELNRQIKQLDQRLLILEMGVGRGGWKIEPSALPQQPRSVRYWSWESHEWSWEPEDDGDLFNMRNVVGRIRELEWKVYHRR